MGCAEPVTYLVRIAAISVSDLQSPFTEPPATVLPTSLLSETDVQAAGFGSLELWLARRTPPTLQATPCFATLTSSPVYSSQPIDKSCPTSWCLNGTVAAFRSNICRFAKPFCRSGPNNRLGTLVAKFFTLFTSTPSPYLPTTYNHRPFFRS